MSDESRAMEREAIEQARVLRRHLENAGEPVRCQVGNAHFAVDPRALRAVLEMAERCEMAESEQKQRAELLALVESEALGILTRERDEAQQRADKAEEHMRALRGVAGDVTPDEPEAFATAVRHVVRDFRERAEKAERERDAYRTELVLDREGADELRRAFGAHDHETFHDFVRRLHAELHEARLDASRVCYRPGCTAAVIRREDGSRYCASGHQPRCDEAIQRAEEAEAELVEVRERQQLAEASEARLVDESLEIARALGVDTSGDYDLPGAAREMREERDAARSEQDRVRRDLWTVIEPLIAARSAQHETVREVLDRAHRLHGLTDGGDPRWIRAVDTDGCADALDALMVAVRAHVDAGRPGLHTAGEEPPVPIPMVLHCPECRARHIDEGDFASKPHHTHSCQGCGFTWRPAVVPTVGARFLPGFKNDPVDTPAGEEPRCPCDEGAPYRCNVVHEDAPADEPTDDYGERLARWRRGWSKWVSPKVLQAIEAYARIERGRR